MNAKTKLLLGIAAFILLIGGSAFLYQTLIKNYKPSKSLNTDTVVNPPTSSEDSSAEEEKMLAPDFSVIDSEGNTVRLSDFIGKPVILNFWASWCPPCKEEMPEFNKVWQEVGEDVVFMMINATDGGRETQETAKKFLESTEYTFPIYYDTTQDASYLYGVSSLPTTVFIDAQGYLVTGAIGMIDEEILRKGIDMIMPEKNSSTNTAEYHKISPEEAKEMMASDNHILLDVRTQEEFDDGHIEGATLIPDTEIAERAEAELRDKTQTILIYCRSGRRSELAAKALVAMGYSAVYDFGGIMDWPY